VTKPHVPTPARDPVGAPQRGGARARALRERGRACGELPAHLDPELAAIVLAGAVGHRRVTTGLGPPG
jgi:hypothetical protein